MMACNWQISAADAVALIGFTALAGVMFLIVFLAGSGK